MNVNLTEYLTQARADQIIEVRGSGDVTPQLHLETANVKKRCQKKTKSGSDQAQPKMPKEMPDKNDSIIQRMKKLPLYQWGAIFIFAGIFTNLAMGLMIQAGDMSRREERASQMGAAIGGGLVILIGVGLIVAHFVRRKSS